MPEDVLPSVLWITGILVLLILGYFTFSKGGE